VIDKYAFASFSFISLQSSRSHVRKYLLVGKPYLCRNVADKNALITATQSCLLFGIKNMDVFLSRNIYHDGSLNHLEKYRGTPFLV